MGDFPSASPATEEHSEEAGEILLSIPVDEIYADVVLPATDPLKGFKSKRKNIT